MSAFCDDVLGAALQVGRGVAGVGGERADGRARLVEPALELEREEQVGELGLPVGAPARVAAALPVEVVEVDRARCGARRRRRSTTRSVTCGQQQVGQREVAEVVGAELHLEAVRGALLGHGHHAGVVDQDVEVALPGVGERAHGGEVGEVERADLGLAGDRRRRPPRPWRGRARRGRRARRRGRARARRRGRCRCWRR